MIIIIIIIVNVSTIENTYMYDEISKWCKNTFLVPFGETGCYRCEWLFTSVHWS